MESIKPLDPKDNRAIFAVMVIDMADDVRDVAGLVHLCAPSMEEAVRRAVFLFEKQGLVKEGGKYHFQVGVVGNLPDVPQIIRPTAEQSKVIVAR